MKLSLRAWWSAQRRSPRLVLAVRVFAAALWITFGFLFKVLGLVPRHRMIVATFFGDELAGPITILVGLGETGMGLWVLSGYRPRLCVALQTAAIVSMNTLELLFAWDLLLAPIPMVIGNALFLAVQWWAALNGREARALL